LIAYRLPGVAAGVVWKYDVGHIAEESSESKADEVAGEPKTRRNPEPQKCQF